MHVIDLPQLEAPDDPAPTFATDAEIAIAEWLRHRIEERYLTPPVAPPPLPSRPNERR
jgi:hypothetical protein